MPKPWIYLALMPLMFGCASASIASAAGSPAATQCEIRAMEIPGGLRLEGVVRGNPGKTGSYQFTLAKSGAGGSSDVSQGGDFTVAASGEVVASATELNLGAHDGYKAVMTVSGPLGASRCERGEPG